ncbi:monovalent cation/H+ antiporter complex subunit F [Rhodococcus sp. X156]|uniref:monovalent cation/H+ antiporter complex subunit F n=1 Tax=Rhodococcus sp. X156 TaxID=2499145 RepID=UPI000FDC9E2D|nr:monovalent cation/H+ antiporter complex subunit F [Rhodococcus sp. X156]
MTVLAVVLAVIFTLAGAFTVVRIVRGPTTLDRVVAVDVLVAVILCALGAQAAVTKDSSTVPAIVALSLLSFVGSVSVARFRVRDDQ